MYIQNKQAKPSNKAEHHSKCFGQRFNQSSANSLQGFGAVFKTMGSHVVFSSIPLIRRKHVRRMALIREVSNF